MQDNQSQPPRARFTRSTSSAHHNPTERRRGRWTGYYPLSEAVAEARLSALFEQKDGAAKEDS